MFCVLVYGGFRAYKEPICDDVTNCEHWSATENIMWTSLARTVWSLNLCVFCFLLFQDALGNLKLQTLGMSSR